MVMIGRSRLPAAWLAGLALASLIWLAGVAHAEPVGAEPLARLRHRQPPGDLAAELDHGASDLTPRRVFRWSATRRALAMMVRAGFTAALEGKKLPSTT